MQEIGDLFYNVILPPLLMFAIGYLTWVLQRRSGSATVDEFQKLFDEVQEERTELKAEIEKYKSERALLIQGISDCDSKVEEYRNQITSVMDEDTARYKKLEERLHQVEEEKERKEAENQSLRALINALTGKLSLAEERLTVALKQLDRMKLDIKKVKKQTGELRAVSEKDNDEKR